MCLSDVANVKSQPLSADVGDKIEASLCKVYLETTSYFMRSVIHAD